MYLKTFVFVFRWNSILGLLLGAELVGVTASALSAVVSLGGESGVALTADFLLNVVLLGKGSDGGLHSSSSESQDQVES